MRQYSVTGMSCAACAARVEKAVSQVPGVDTCTVSLLTNCMGLVQLVLTGIIMVINQKFFISGFKSMIHRAPNMDALVALGSSAAFLWSLYVLFAMTRAAADGNGDAVMVYMMDFYFESAAMILSLITVGKMLEARSKGRTTDALKGLALALERKSEHPLSKAILRKAEEQGIRPSWLAMGSMMLRH